MMMDSVLMCGAMILLVGLIAPLGSVSLAANTFGITAEALCYMPAYGVGIAANTLVGQSLGAGKKSLAGKFAWVSVQLGMGIMAVTGALMYIFSPQVMSFFTADPETQVLSVTVLRTELWAEPLFGASIVVAGALRGAKDTLVPGILNLVSMWGIRLPLAFLLVSDYGLLGVWIAMCLELCVRGILMLLRLRKKAQSF